MKNTTDTLLVSFDFTNGKDKSVLIVGRKHPNQAVTIVNAFQNEEAEIIYDLLLEKKVRNAEVSESLGSENKDRIPAAKSNS